MRQYSKAIADLTQLLKLDPNAAGALEERAGYYRIIGKPALAARDEAAAKKLRDTQD